MTGTGRQVWIVDDDLGIRTSLTRALRQRGFGVEAFDSAAAFLAGYDGESAGCVVLDYGMPDVNGLELQAELNSRGWPLAVIFITGHGGVRESVQAMKGGAIDFLEKPFRQSELVERIEAALVAAETLRTADANRQRIRSRFSRLTERETEIVEQVLTNPAASSSKELAAALGISPRTVDHHRARIMEKMGVRSMVELVRLASGLGET